MRNIILPQGDVILVPIKCHSSTKWLMWFGNKFVNCENIYYHLCIHKILGWDVLSKHIHELERMLPSIIHNNFIIPLQTLCLVLFKRGSPKLTFITWVYFLHDHFLSHLKIQLRTLTYNFIMWHVVSSKKKQRSQNHLVAYWLIVAHNPQIIKSPIQHRKVNRMFKRKHSKKNLHKFHKSCFKVKD